jgi:predicted permease
MRVGRVTIRDAAKATGRAPGHTRSILLMLALGIAAATVTFSVVDAVVLRPLPFERSDDLIFIGGRTPGWPTNLSAEEFWAIHDGVPALDSVGSLRTYKSPATVGTVTEEVAVTRSTADLFTVFRLRPVLGRLWTSNEDRSGDSGLAVLSFEYWQKRFAGNSNVVGAPLRIGDKSYQIVGVLPRIVDAEATLSWSPDVWIQAVPQRENQANGVARVVVTIGRLRGGSSLVDVDRQVKSALAPLAATTPMAYTDWRVEVKPWQAAMVGDARGWMLLLLGAVTLMVLIACVNAANLMLTRSVQRSRELAVRASLGASRRQLALTLLVESVMISTAATLGGLLLSAWGVKMVKSALPPGVFRASAIALNERVFVAAAIAAIATGVLFGSIPAWQASRVSMLGLLKDAAPTSTPARRAWRSALLVSQIACIGILLVASIMFVASFVRVLRANLGLTRTNLVGVSASGRVSTTIEEMRSRLEQVPGVSAVASATASSLPLVGPAFGGGYADTKLRVDGSSETAPVLMQMWRVTPNYFDVSGMRFLRGSSWRSADPDFTPVVLDEAAARRLFGNRDPIGSRLRGSAAGDLFTVVGIVGTVFWRGPDVEPRPTAYFPVLPSAKGSGASYFVRSSVPAETLVRSLEGIVASMAPAGSHPQVRLVDEAFSRLTTARRFNAGIMGAFALFAVLIGAAGTYATVTSLVAQQTHEIGVRLALGATSHHIWCSVLTVTGRCVLVGLAIGLPAGWWISRGFASLLFQVQPGDVSTYVIAAVTIALAALVASILPARRASRVDPLVSLRSV